LSALALPAPVVDVDGTRVFVGDAVALLPLLACESIDSVVTDPPYGLGFNGLGWDGPAAFRLSLDAAGAAPDGRGAAWSEGRLFGEWCRAWAAGALAALKPGGHLVAFGGTRTWHRLAVGVEDAGFEVRDQVAWLHTSGMPKSLDLSNAIDRRLGAVRADRVVEVAPLDSVLGATRRVAAKGTPVTREARRWEGWGTGLKPAFEPIVVARKPCQGGVAANTLAHGVGGLNIDAARQPGSGRWPANVALDGTQAARLGALAGEGVAGRFPVFHHEPKAQRSERPRAFGASHATVKPLALMRWLVGLVTPPGGVVLDPFAGSGTTVEAALAGGFRAVAFEREAAYVPLIQARLDRLAAGT
jgi:site-specific DNA-methyltransferase (adenine-specific)